MTTATRPPTTATGRARRNAAQSAPAGSDWLTQAACREVDPELFFPVGLSAAARAQTERAKAVCEVCPVRSECLKWALDTGQTAGVWGGMSEHDRWELGARPVPRRSDAGQPRVRPAFDRCVAAREWIEEQVASGVPVRQVARLLGVNRDSVRRARDFYLSEDAALDAASEAVKAA